jgi:hypothetical protein
MPLALRQKTKAAETFLGKKLRTPADKIVTQLVPLKYADALTLGRKERKMPC